MISVTYDQELDLEIVKEFLKELMEAKEVSLMLENRDAKELNFRATFDNVEKCILNLMRFHGKLYKGHPLVISF